MLQLQQLSVVVQGPQQGVVLALLGLHVQQSLADEGREMAVQPGRRLAARAGAAQGLHFLGQVGQRIQPRMVLFAGAQRGAGLARLDGRVQHLVFQLQVAAQPGQHRIDTVQRGMQLGLVLQVQPPQLPERLRHAMTKCLVDGAVEVVAGGKAVHGHPMRGHRRLVGMLRIVPGGTLADIARWSHRTGTGGPWR